MYPERAQRISVDGRPKRSEMYALSNETHLCGQGQKVIRISLFRGPRCNVQISWKLIQKTCGDWGRPSLTVIWASQCFGHPHSQNPSDPNPNPNPNWWGNMSRGCLYHWGFGNGDAHITATSPIQLRPQNFSLRKLKKSWGEVAATAFCPDHSSYFLLTLFSGSPHYLRPGRGKTRTNL